MHTYKIGEKYFIFPFFLHPCRNIDNTRRKHIMDDNKNMVGPVNFVPAVIDWQLEKAKADALKISDEYSKIVVTDKNYKAAKADAKTLAGYILDIEAKRKEVKKALEAPIKEFDANCKDIENILLTAKETILEKTTVYDEQIKAEKTQKANDYRDAQIKKAALNERYSTLVVIRPEYSNLTTTFKSIKEDLDDQIMHAKSMQDREAEAVKTINDALVLMNNDITSKMQAESFTGIAEQFITDPSMTSVNILNAISEEHDKIKATEEKIRKEAEEKAKEKAEAEAKAKVEAELQAERDAKEKAEKAAEAAKQAEEAAKQAEEQAKKRAEAEMEAKNKALVEAAKMEAEKKRAEEKVTVINADTAGPRYHMVIAIDGSGTTLTELGDKLKKICEDNGCTFTVNKMLSHKIK
jgi:hypothetical protein